MVQPVVGRVLRTLLAAKPTDKLNLRGITILNDHRMQEGQKVTAQSDASLMIVICSSRQITGRKAETRLALGLNFSISKRLAVPNGRLRKSGSGKGTP